MKLALPCEKPPRPSLATRLSVAGRPVSDAGQLVLYYDGASVEDSQRYVAGPVYAKIAAQLQALVQNHLLLLGKLVSD